MTVSAYSTRMRGMVNPYNAVWQVVPTAAEHIRELLSEPGGLAATAGSHPGFKNHGNSQITNPRLVIIDIGPWWSNTAKRDQFAKEVMTFGYLTGLKNYGSGNGSYWGSIQIAPLKSPNVTDAQLQQILRDTITAGKVPSPDGHTLYVLNLQDGVTIDDGDGQNCSAFCGYHSALDPRTFYTVQPATTCSGCHGNFEPFNAYTMVLAHEIAEACTDAVPGQGWFVDDKSDSMNGAENADLEAWIGLQWGPWVVQGYYTNETGNTVGPYVPIVVPQPNPTATAVVLASDPAVQPVQLNVTVVGGSPAPTGSVAMYDGLGMVGGGPLTQGSFTSSLRLAPGTHQITARYAGDAMNQPSVSAAVIVVVPKPVPLPAPDYSRLIPLVQWAVENYHGSFIDVFEKLDPKPADVLIFEEWRTEMKVWGMLP